PYDNRYGVANVGGPRSNCQRVGGNADVARGYSNHPAEHQIAKGVAVDSLAAAITSINVPAMKSHVLGSALSKATADWGSASREERIMAHYFLFSFFKLLENAWYQRQAGILDQAQWVGWETLLRKYYHAEGVRSVWWPGRTDAYSPEFKKFLSATKQPDELGSLNELFDYAVRNY